MPEVGGDRQRTDERAAVDRLDRIARLEAKDAHDLHYCLAHAEGGREAIQQTFCRALESDHPETIRAALEMIRAHFCGDPKTKG